MRKIAALLVGLVLAFSATAQTWQRIGGSGLTSLVQKLGFDSSIFKNYLICNTGSTTYVGDAIFSLSHYHTNGYITYVAVNNRQIYFLTNGAYYSNTESSNSCAGYSFQQLTSMGKTFN